jgi:hypothetical protein
MGSTRWPTVPRLAAGGRRGAGAAGGGAAVACGVVRAGAGCRVGAGCVTAEGAGIDDGMARGAEANAGPRKPVDPVRRGEAVADSVGGGGIDPEVEGRALDPGVVGGADDAETGSGTGDCRGAGRGGAAAGAGVRLGAADGGAAGIPVAGRASSGRRTAVGGADSGSNQARAGRCSAPFAVARAVRSGCGWDSPRARAGLGWSSSSGMGTDAGSSTDRSRGAPPAWSDPRMRVGGSSSDSAGAPPSGVCPDRRPTVFSGSSGSPASSASERSGRAGRARRGRGAGSSTSSSSSSASTPEIGPLERRGTYLTTGSAASDSSRSARRGRITGTVSQAFRRLAQGSNAFVPEGTRSLPAEWFRRPRSCRIVDVYARHTTFERTPIPCRLCTAPATTG